MPGRGPRVRSPAARARRAGRRPPTRPTTRRSRRDRGRARRARHRPPAEGRAGSCARRSIAVPGRTETPPPARLSCAPSTGAGRSPGSRSASRPGSPSGCVATRLVEAGVDVDFASSTAPSAGWTRSPRPPGGATAREARTSEGSSLGELRIYQAPDSAAPRLPPGRLSPPRAPPAGRIRGSISSTRATYAPTSSSSTRSRDLDRRSPGRAGRAPTSRPSLTRCKLIEDDWSAPRSCPTAGRRGPRAQLERPSALRRRRLRALQALHGDEEGREPRPRAWVAAKPARRCRGTGARERSPGCLPAYE